MFKDEFRRLRKKRGLNQEQIAEMLNVSQSTITAWEKGARRPDMETIPVIARFFGVSTDELYGIEHENSNDREIWEAREAAKRDPNRHKLFKLAKDGSAQAVKQAAAIIDAMRATNPEFYDDDD